MAAKIQLQPQDLDPTCSLDPADEHVHDKRELRPEQGWNPASAAEPYARPKPWKTNPEQGSANPVTTRLEWDDYRIEIKRDLLQTLFDLVSQAAQSLATGLGGNVQQALTTFVGALRTALAQSTREVAVYWEFHVQLEPAAATHYVYVYHQEDAEASIRNVLGIAGGQSPVTWAVECKVTVDNQVREPLQVAEGTFMNVGPFESAEEDAFPLPGGKRSFELVSRLRLSADGFQSELKTVLQQATALLQELISFQLNAQRLLANIAGSLFGKLYEQLSQTERTQAGQELERQRQALEQRIRDSAQKLVDALLALANLVLDQWEGVVELHYSRINVTCVTEAAYRRIRETLDGDRGRKLERQVGMAPREESYAGTPGPARLLRFPYAITLPSELDLQGVRPEFAFAPVPVVSAPALEARAGGARPPQGRAR